MVALLVVVVAGAGGGSVADQLSVGGYTDPQTESARADAVLSGTLHVEQPNLVLLISDPRGVDDPDVAARGLALTRRLAAEPSVSDVTSYWAAGRPASLRSRAGDRALMVARVEGTDDQVHSRMKTLAPRYSGVVGGLQVRPGGLAEANVELTDLTRADGEKAEAVALPLTLLALIVIFGSVVAAGTPFAVGVGAMVGTLLVLRLVDLVTPVSVLALNITTVLGLGLGIDYSLFIVTRYREELANGRDVPAAIAAALSTAGRTVLFSAVTVALALASLLLLPFEFLRSFAYAGIPTALFAALAAVVVLPALLAVLGPRIDRFRLLRWRVAGPSEAGFWQRLATWVMRRPVPVLVVVVALLAGLGLPFLHLQMGLADERVLPASSNAYQVGRVLRQDFDYRDVDSLLVVARGVDPEARADDVTAYAERLSLIANVSRVDAVTGSFAHGARIAPPSPSSSRFASGSATYLAVVPSVDATSSAARELLRRVRGAASPFPIEVTGPTAVVVDSLGALYGALPLALTAMAVSLVVLLFLMTGSLVVPLKAIVLNVLSLSATFGVLVWGFQDGHLRGWIGDFTVTGTITWTVVVLLFAVAFGLSMDYEVFLLSRIKEEYDASGDNRRAVALGLQRTGRLVTAAAVVMSMVFISLVTSGVTYIKAVGPGLALAVVMDATVVRGLLVPAFMRLAGRANWWAPPALRRLHSRIGIAESAGGPAAAGPVETSVGGR